MVGSLFSKCDFSSFLRPWEHPWLKVNTCHVFLSYSFNFCFMFLSFGFHFVFRCIQFPLCSFHVPFISFHVLFNWHFSCPFIEQSWLASGQIWHLRQVAKKMAWVLHVSGSYKATCPCRKSLIRNMKRTRHARRWSVTLAESVHLPGHHLLLAPRIPNKTFAVAMDFHPLSPWNPIHNLSGVTSPKNTRQLRLIIRRFFDQLGIENG